MTELINDAISDGISLDGNGTNDTLAPVVTEETNTAKPDSIYGSGDAVYIKTTDLAASDETSKAPIPPTTADETSKAPIPPATADETSKAPIPPATADETSKAPIPPTTADETSKAPMPPKTVDETSKAPIPPTTADETSKAPMPPKTADETSKAPIPHATADETSKAPIPPTTADETSKAPMPPKTVDETSKAPIPPTTADETSKAPMLPAATEKTSKVPIPRAATGMNSANSASGSMNETISTVPKPLPPGILLSTSQAAPTNGDSGAGGGGDLSRIDSSAAMVTEASPAPLPELSAAEASEVASASSQRSGGPPPVKVRRREPPPSQQQQQQQQLGLADSAAEQQFLPPRNYQFIAGDLEYFIVCGLPLTTTDASLKRTFKGLLKKSLCEISQVIIVPEIDSKTVLVFSGNGATATAKVAKNLTLKRLQKKLQSSLFVSRFPEDANLKNLRAYASYSEEYLYKWTRLYFCPVSLQLAEEIQCQHFLVSNLSQSLLRSPSDLLIKFSQTMPTARSFFLPVDESESPLGYMLVRFNKSEDCLACYRLLQKHYSMEMTFVSLLEVCRLPGGYQVPAHNLLNWCRLERPAAGASVQQSQPAQPRIVLDDPVRSPYLCTCHPAGQSVAPPPEKLHLVANELETTLLANPGASIVDFKSLLSAITGEDSKVLANVLDVQPEPVSPDEFDAYFDLSGTVEFLRQLQRQQSGNSESLVVGLQLPSPLFHCARRLVEKLSSLLTDLNASSEADASQAKSVQLRLLADTDSCCVDCVTAAHCGCAAVIHYGDACFSRCPHLPVHYVLGSVGKDAAENSAQQLAGAILASVYGQDRGDEPGSLLLIAPGALHASVLTATRDCLVARLPKGFDVHLATPGPLASESDRSSARFLCGRWVPEDFFPKDENRNRNRYVIHVTTDADSLLGVAVGLAFLNIGPVYQCVCQTAPDSKAYSVSSVDRIDTDRRFKRRLLLSSKAKEARRVGLLLCGCVESLTPSLDYALKLVHSAGRLPYIVSVGRINPAKLANYADIDAFALIGCYLRALLDSRDYFQPLLSMVELERALNPNREFEYAYCVDFADCLPGGRSFVQPPIPTAESEGDGDKKGQLVLRNGNLQVALPASEFLTNRSWRGLDPQLGATPVARLEQGRSGLAIRYDSDETTASRQAADCKDKF